MEYPFHGLLVNFTRIPHKPVNHTNNCEMFGQVQTITYIMLSTAPTYETSDMCSFFSLLLDDKLEDNLKWIVSGVLPDF